MQQKPSRAELQATFAALGMAVHVLHEIESYFAQAILLGLTDRQKRKHKNMNELWSAREKMTFGQLVAHFKEDWILEATFEGNLDNFVLERNVVIHRLTALDGYGVETTENLKTLNARLLAFIEKAFLMRRFFHGAFLTSNEFASHTLKHAHGIDIPLETPPEWIENRDMFRSLAIYKHGPDDDSSTPGPGSVEGKFA